MPVVFKEFINTDCVWGIWEISEQPEDLRKLIHIPELQKKADSISHPVKRCEWMSSRLLAEALSEEIGTQFSGVINDECGCPHLVNSSYYLSLSHTQRYSVAIVHKKKKVGIDIELIREKLHVVSNKFLSYRELEMTGTDLKKLGICWAAKEVLYKIYSNRSLSLKNDIAINDFTPEKEGICYGEINSAFGLQTFAIKYLEFKQYIIAFNY